MHGVVELGCLSAVLVVGRDRVVAILKRAVKSDAMRAELAVRLNILR